MTTEEDKGETGVRENSEEIGMPVANPSFTVVGVGASAGGLRALQSFFGAVSPNSGMVYVVILHLDPDHESQMAHLLQNCSVIPVEQVTAPIKVEVDHAYIIPPTRNLSMVDGTIQLSERGERGDQAPIDLFFRTLAEAYGSGAVGIVLSGTGSDGASGLRRIKEMNGITIVQDPEEADFDGMPRSAIETGQVDLVLSAEEIPGRLLRLTREQPRISSGAGAETSPEDEESLMRQIFGRLRGKTGHDFSGYKRSTVMRRLDRRLRFNGITTLPDYVTLLRKDGEEVHALFQDLLISVSNFFRDPDAFTALERKVVPKLFERKGRDDQVRVWVAGCATGEEAYSVAILLKEHAAKLAHPPQIQVFATDIDENACALAREALYPDTIAVDISPQRLESFFERESGGYRVRKSLRKDVLFATHDVLKDPPFSRLDLVSCRNLLIYLGPQAQERVVESFHYGLRPDGFLLLGSSEAIGGADLFTPIDGKRRIYRRVSTAHAVVPRLSTPDLPRRPADPAEEAPAKERARSFSYGAVHLRMLEAYSPPSVIVDEDARIVHLSERAGRYLRLAGGNPTMNLIDLATGDLRLELRAALYEALHRGLATTRRVRVEVGEDFRLVDVHVRPHEHEGRRLALVVFEERAGPAAANETSAMPAERGAVAQLEEDLRRTREQLDAIIRSRDVTIEELQSANEELRSINEEHRATTEEMMTSREELQSINEELATVNQEHRGTIEELKQVNADIGNLLEATEIGTLFLDGRLRIRRFTPSLTKLFNLVPADQGRPLAHVTHRLRYQGLAQDAEHAVVSLEAIDREIENDSGDWYNVRIHPYLSAADRIDGAVLTFYDITGRKRLEDELRAAKALAEEANRTKGVFVDTLSHELRTPLNGILGYADVLMVRGGLDESQIRSVERIKAGVWHLATMIEEILTLAKLDAGKESIAWEWIDAGTLAYEAAALVEPGMAAKGLGFSLHLPESEVEIETDRGKARQILVNLLGNAIKYTLRGEVRLELRAGEDRVAFSVCDTGIGIAAENTEHVFERFWQVSHGLTRTIGGTGLGLAAAREFARLLGGEVEVESEFGRGSVFTFWLPRRRMSSEMEMGEPPTA